MLAHFDWIEVIRSSPVSIVIIGCSIVTLAVVIERSYYFRRRRGNPDRTLGYVLKKLSSGGLKEAVWTCEHCSHPLGQVALDLLRSNNQERDGLEEQMQISLSEQKMLLERNLVALGTMAVMAPLIGLLGTVWGIMRAFSDMANTGSAAPSVVAAGVAEALITTAAGLVIAVPALILYNHFTHRMNVMLTVAENHARKIRSALVHAEGLGFRRHDGFEPVGQALPSPDIARHRETAGMVVGPGGDEEDQPPWGK
jgi:biopolymer transport protein ExbB